MFAASLESVANLSEEMKKKKSVKDVVIIFSYMRYSTPLCVTNSLSLKRKGRAGKVERVE